MGALFSAVDKFLNGKKTALGTISGIATFVLVVTQVLADGFQFADLNIIMGGFSALMIAIGLGHKAKKVEDLIKK